MFNLRKDNTVAKFKTHLKTFMKERGLSRMDMVRDAKMSYPTVVKWETEGMQHLDAELVITLMKLLDIKLEELIYTVEEGESAQ